MRFRKYFSSYWNNFTNFNVNSPIINYEDCFKFW